MNELRSGSGLRARRAAARSSIAGSISKLAQAADRTRAALEGYRFNEAAAALYHFTWDEFCDWYLELAKPLLAGEDEAAKAETRATAAWVLAQLLHLLHPLTPFVTEELWERRYGAPGGLLIGARWPELGGELIDPEAEAELDWLIRAISALRAARSELGVPPAAKLTAQGPRCRRRDRARLARHRDALLRLARLAEIEPTEAPVPQGSLQVVVDEATFALPLAGVIDLEQERQRLGKELARARAEIERFDQKLADHELSRARARRGDRDAARAPRRGRADPPEARSGARPDRFLARTKAMLQLLRAPR